MLRPQYGDVLDQLGNLALADFAHKNAVAGLVIEKGLRLPSGRCLSSLLNRKAVGLDRGPEGSAVNLLIELLQCTKRKRSPACILDARGVIAIVTHCGLSPHSWPFILETLTEKDIPNLKGFESATGHPEEVEKVVTEIECFGKAEVFSAYQLDETRSIPSRVDWWAGHAFGRAHIMDNIPLQKKYAECFQGVISTEDLIRDFATFYAFELFKKSKTSDDYLLIAPSPMTAFRRRRFIQECLYSILHDDE